MIRKWIVILASIGLAVVWGAAAFLKSLDPEAFAQQIALHKMTPEAWSLPLAYFFIGIEILLAVAHITLYRPRLAFVGSGVLLLFFIGVTGWAWSQGNTEGCGCFGRLAARSPIEVILEDTAFVAAAALGFFMLRDWRPPKFSTRAFAALLPLCLILPLAGPAIPADALVTTFNPGEDLSYLAADDLPFPLDEGRVLLLLVTDPCTPCVDGLARLDEIVEADETLSVVAVFAGTRREAQSWALDHVPPFGVASAPVKVLRQYYRKLPQVALLEKGIIKTVWRNRIPSWSEVKPELEIPSTTS